MSGRVFQFVRSSFSTALVELEVFFVQKKEIDLITIQATSSEVDLSTPASIHEALTNQTHQLKFFRSKRTHSKEREAEVHQLVEQGCSISSEDFWNALNASIS